MESNQPLISVIILIYHDEKYLKDCLSSLKLALKKAEISYELIFVVNDPSLKKKKYLFPENCTIIFNKINKGFAASFNQGSQSANGEWLLSINPDTWSYPDSIKYLIEHFKDTQIAAVVPKVLNSDRTLQYTILSEPTLLNIFLQQSYLYKLFPFFFHHPLGDKSVYEKKHYVDYSSGTCLLIKKNVFNNIGRFDPSYFLYCEDYDLWKRFNKTGLKLLYEPQARIIHFRHQSSQGFMDGRQLVKSHYLFLRKFRPRLYADMGILMITTGSAIRYIFWHIKKIIITSEKEITFTDRKINYYRDMTAEGFSLLKNSIFPNNLL